MAVLVLVVYFSLSIFTGIFVFLLIDETVRVISVMMLETWNYI